MLAFHLLAFFFSLQAISALDEITPYKFDQEGGIQPCKIPPSSRFTTKRAIEGAPQLVYYLSKPSLSSYPIAILCTGSTSKEDVMSVIHFHRYFLKEFSGLGLGVLTVEQWGVDGENINQQEFMNHYTRPQRLQDHNQVIQALIENPPQGWNGKFVFFGVSEGTLLTCKLTEDQPERTLATLSWAGPGDESWQKELWTFIKTLRTQNVTCPHSCTINSCETCLKPIKSRESYDSLIDTIKSTPSSDQYFFGMTYRYHADALSFPDPNYKKITTPFLLVVGTEDPGFESSDTLAQKAKEAGAPITYLPIKGMDHYIRKRPDVQKQSFDWLKTILESQRF